MPKLGRRRTAQAALLVTTLLGPLPLHAYTAEDAGLCAAFSLANWDYETKHFEPDDRSPEWKSQAAAFVKTAQRMGLANAKTYANQRRKGALEIVEGFIFQGTAGSEKKFKSLSRLCDKIIDDAPEMADHR